MQLDPSSISLNHTL